MAHVLIAILGVWLLLLVLRSMIRIALMNRHSRDFFARVTCRAVYTAVAVRLGGSRDTRTTHPVLLWFFPVYMLSLTVVYFVGAMSGFTLLYWGTRAVSTWQQALLASGSALNTLGFATPATIAGQWLAVPEGALGLGIVVFLFTFIPGYQAVIRAREDRTSWLYVRVGNQPTGVGLLDWCQRTGLAPNMRDMWEAWEDWFRLLGDTHSVLPMLSMSPSVQSSQSWLVAAAAVLDAGALAASSIETQDVEAASICVRTGARALVAIADALGRTGPDEPESATRPSRKEYEAVRTLLSLAGMPSKRATSEEVQWQEFLLLRSQYESALLFIASHTFTPLDHILFHVRDSGTETRRYATSALPGR
jgi:hypothetical protein